jgi:mediator of RNA polymerase II transcription subunit 12
MASGSQVSPKTAAAMLELIAAPAQTNGLSIAEEYTFKLQQQRFYEEQSEDVMNLLRKATEDQAFPLDSDWILDLTLQIITGHPDKFRNCFTEDRSSPAVQQAAVRISESLLSQDQRGTATSGLDACQVIRSANALNAPFSIGWLHIYTNSQTTNATLNEDAIRNALLKAVADKSEVWPQLLSAAKPETLKEIHIWARSSILSAVCPVQEDDHVEDKAAIEMFCQVLDVTYSSIKGEDDAQNLVLLTDKLKAQEKSLSDLDATDPDYQTHLRIMTGRLNILLHLCTLPAQATSISDNGKQARNHLLAVLCSLLIHSRLDRHQTLTNHIHDVAALHADSLPEETLSQVSRQFHPPTAPLRSLLGSFNTQSVASTTPSLALASRAQPAQSQQQRALARRQPLPGGSAGAGAGGGANTARPTNVERKLTPYPLRTWEIMPDPTPVMGENDCAVSLGLFGARKV